MMRTPAAKLLAWALCLALSLPSLAAEGNPWKLLETTAYGTGGSWENGQTVRIDRSFKSGTFSYERKVTAGQSLSVFSSKGVFSALKAEYAPGETVSVTVSVSASGSEQAAPEQVYGRVTLLPGDPGWTRANWASQKIAAAGTVAGQLTNSGGSFLVTPGGFDELTLSGTIPTSGNRMAIVFSCNGMDVLHLYGREGAAQETAAAEAPARKVEDADKTTGSAESTETVETEEKAKEKPVREKKVREKKTLEIKPVAPRVKLLLLGVLLLAAIFDLLYMFSKPKE
jgi:hypothetical protein